MAVQPTNMFDTPEKQEDPGTNTPSGSATIPTSPNENVSQQIANMSIMTQTTSNFAEGEIESLADQHAEITIENQRRGDDDVDNLAGEDDDSASAPIIGDDDSANASTMTTPSDDNSDTAAHHADTSQNSDGVITASDSDTPNDTFSDSSGDTLGSAGQDMFLLQNDGDLSPHGGISGTEIAPSTDGITVDQTWGNTESAPMGGDSLDAPGGMNFDDSASNLPPIDTGGMGGGGF